MQQEKDRAESVTPTKEDAERDATSKETVGDLNEGARTAVGGAGVNSDRTEPSSSSSAPSPDGQFDGPRDNAGEDPGPM